MLLLKVFKQIKIHLVHTVFFLGLILSAAPSMAQNYFPILQYHHVSSKTPFSTSVTPAQFQEQMDYLDEAGFVVVDLADAIQKIQHGEELPEKAVAITFDDAYLDIYKEGYPILKKKGFPFTIFINTQPIEWKSDKFLTWADMKEMQKHKAVLANHTFSHPYMLRMEDGETHANWRERITKEVKIVESQLVDELGTTPKMIAYPYGESNSELRSLIKDMGLIGLGQQSGVVNIHSDFSNLPRFPASGNYADLSGLKTKLASLPMPLTDVDRGSDYASSEPVSMTLSFDEGKYRFKDLACYVSGQGKADLHWLTNEQVKVVAKQAFNYGRGRINCTMPSMKNNQFYWFSSVWIRPKPEQGYIPLKN